MEPREIVRRTLEFKKPERMALWLHKFGPNDFAGLPVQKPEGWEPAEPGMDEFGCLWVKTEVQNLGQVKGHPLADLDRLKDYKWPDPSDPSRFRDFDKALANPDLQTRFVGAGFTNGLFERTWMLHGFEAAMMDFILRPKQIHELIECITGVHIEMCRAIHRHSHGRADYYSMPDDLGCERGPFFSMKIWNEFYHEPYKRLINAVHDLGMVFYLHTDGYMPEILDDLCALGLDIVNIQQPLMYGIDFIAKRYKGKITLDVYPDTQQLMPWAKPDEIRAHVRELVEKLDSPEGGFIAGVYADEVGGGTTEEASRIAADEFVSLQHLHHRQTA